MNIHKLETVLNRLYSLLDAGADVLEETNTLEDLIREEREKQESFESSCDRWRAEKRLAYHIENDTLDTY